jgi:hypothetical protein
MSDKPAKKISKGRYDEATIEHALQALALEAGGLRRTEARLKAEGYTISRDTLKVWREKHAGRYETIQRDVLPKLRDAIAAHYMAVSADAVDVSAQIAERMRENIDNIRPADLARTLQATITSAGIATDKANVLQGMPVTITQTTSAEDILKRLASQGLAVIDGTAEDITDVEALPEPSEIPEIPSYSTTDGPQNARD